jgi:hypothetical protein
MVEEFYNKNDFIKIIMITNCQKTYLAEEYTADHVQNYFRNKLIPRVFSAYLKGASV